MEDKTLRNKIEYYCRQYYNQSFLEERRNRINNLQKTQKEIYNDTPSVEGQQLTDMPRGGGDNNHSSVEDFIIRKEEKILNIQESINREVSKMERDINIINSIDDIVSELNEIEYMIFTYKFRDRKRAPEICYLIDRDPKQYYTLINRIYKKIMNSTDLQ